MYSPESKLFSSIPSELLFHIWKIFIEPLSIEPSNASDTSQGTPSIVRSESPELFVSSSPIQTPSNNSVIVVDHQQSPEFVYNIVSPEIMVDIHHPSPELEEKKILRYVPKMPSLEELQDIQQVVYDNAFYSKEEDVQNVTAAKLRFEPLGTKCPSLKNSATLPLFVSSLQDRVMPAPEFKRNILKYNIKAPTVEELLQDVKQKEKAQTETKAAGNIDSYGRLVLPQVEFDNENPPSPKFDEPIGFVAITGVGVSPNRKPSIDILSNAKVTSPKRPTLISAVCIEICI